MGTELLVAGWYPITPHGLVADWSFRVRSDRGRLLVERYRMKYPDFTPAELAEIARRAPVVSAEKTPAGFEWGVGRPFHGPEGWLVCQVERTDQPLRFEVLRHTKEGRHTGTTLTISHWLVAAATAVLPAWRGFTWHRRRRHKRAAPHQLSSDAGDQPSP